MSTSAGNPGILIPLPQQDAREKSDKQTRLLTFLLTLLVKLCNTGTF